MTSSWAIRCSGSPASRCLPMKSRWKNEPRATTRRKRDHVTARLIVRRVRRLNPKQVPAGQTEAFAVYRYHAVFTDNSEPMLTAEATHRDHAIVEQVIAELKNGPLAHLPSGQFAANAAWLACATIAFPSPAPPRSSPAPATPAPASPPCAAS